MLNNMLNQLNHFVNCSQLVYSKKLVVGMLLSNGHKNCVSMSKPLGISHDVLQKIFAAAPAAIDELKLFLESLVITYQDENQRGWLIIDDSALAKHFAQVLEGLGFVYDSNESDSIKGYKIVVLCWTNQIITIPLSFAFWLPEDLKVKPYKTKLDLARELIIEYKGKIKFYGILLDGLYASEEMMAFFEQNKIIFYMRLPRNRKVKASKHSIEFKIGDNLAFRLKGNTRSRTFVAYFSGKTRYVTAQKRRKRSGEYETVYIVSSEKAESHEAILTYAIRWMIEKFFRTAKQTLGIADCQARSIKKQTLHILTCFASYGILESIKIFKKLSCPEDAHRYLNIAKDDFAFFALHRSNQYSLN